MKARLALVAALALPLGLSAMPTAVEYLPSSAVTLNGGVMLGNMKLPAGTYDVQIHYKGFGNSAEFWFFQNKVFKGKTGAEARGFPSTAPGGAGGLQPDLKYEGIKGESADHKHKDEIVYKDELAYKEQKVDTALKIKLDANEKWRADSPQGSLSWGAQGVALRPTGNAVRAGGSMKISIDSSNSSAGFSTTLPLAK